MEHVINNTSSNDNRAFQEDFRRVASKFGLPQANRMLLNLPQVLDDADVTLEEYLKSSEGRARVFLITRHPFQRLVAAFRYTEINLYHS